MILTNLKITGRISLLLLLFQIFEKAYWQIWTILRTIVLLIPFFKYSKKHTYESENTWDIVFAHILFQIFQIAFLPIWKMEGTILFLWHLFKYFKKHTYESEQYLGQFFCSYPSSNIQESILANLKIPGT